MQLIHLRRFNQQKKKSTSREVDNLIWSMTSSIFFPYSFICECFCLCVFLFVLKGRQRKQNDNFGLQDQVYFHFLYIYFFMCKNMGQPGFDPTLKRPGMGHRLCNPFRTTRFFTRTHLTRTHMGRTRTRLTRPVCQVYSCWYLNKFLQRT